MIEGTIGNIDNTQELEGSISNDNNISGSVSSTQELTGNLIERGPKGDKGDKGDTGDDGEDGEDGISPTVTTSKVGKVTTITIVDAQGTHTATINDGEDGSGTGDMLKSTYDINNNGIVDNAEKVNNHTVNIDVPSNAVFTDTTYTAGTGIDITNNVISNTQTSAEWGNITGTLSSQTDLYTELSSKYTKPNTGIPKTDLASEVQTSLGKADSALQSHQDISGKENTSNKSSSYTTSSTTTYPNTKALVDGLSTKQSNFWSGTLAQYNAITTKDPDTYYAITDDSDMTEYQEKLVSGTNIKTINNNSILGSGNITISGGSTDYDDLTDKPQINGVTLSGNKTTSDLGITIPTKVSDLQNDAGYTTNTGTITGITMNGSSKGTSGVVNLGTVITSHQDISGKENSSNKSNSYTTSSTTTYPNTKALVDGLATKQATLVSGTNIKTINNNSILGSGNIDISSGTTYTAGDGINISNNEISAKVGTGIFFNSNDEISLNVATQNTLAQVSAKQDTLVSGTNIKTINNNSLLGSGNITISGGGSSDPTGIVSQTQTWTRASDNGYDYTMSNTVSGTIPQAFIDMWSTMTRGLGTFNTSTGYFELNGLTDISYAEARRIYSLGDVSVQKHYNTGLGYTYSNAPQGDSTRTYITTIGQMAEQVYLYGDANLECIYFPQPSNWIQYGRGLNWIQNAYESFKNSSHLKRFENITCSNRTALDFSGCYSLETLKLIKIKANVNVSNSARLTNDSILFMINNEGTTNSITITLHATAYARATADSSITSALANHPKVTLVSA